MALFSSFNICASGLTAQRLRSDVIMQNLANVSTTSTSNGNPYVRKTVVFTEKPSTSFDQVLMTTQGAVGNGVKVTKIVEDRSTAMRMVYEPAHPDADENGYVNLPNVDALKETVDSMSATRSYEANVTALNAMKLMAQKALDIGK